MVIAFLSPGESSTVYLISLEHAYSGGNLDKSILNYPYLHKWDFHAFKDQLYSLTISVLEKVKSVNSGITQDLHTIYGDVYTQTSTFQNALKGLGVTDTNDLNALTAAAKLPGSTFHGLLSHLQNGFGPFSTDPQSTGITSTGTIQLPFLHTAENAQGIVQSGPLQYYYRGPLVSGPLNLGGLENSLPGPSSTSLPQHSDELRIQLTGNETIDATYASAFEIGKLTAINDSSFATAYYGWKNEAATAIRANNIEGGNNYPIPTIPDVVNDKIKQWKHLHGIPYRYLIPDPTLLPNESIRFFTLDRYWLYSFLTGAFSIGHTVSTTVPITSANQDFRMRSLIDTLSGFYCDPTPVPMGVLVNSLAVGGWPNFQVKVTYTVNTTTTFVHDVNNNLDTNICLLQFEKAFKQLDFHLHPGQVPTGFLYEGPLNPPQNGTQSLGTYEKKNFAGTNTWLIPAEIGSNFISQERVLSATEIAKALQSYLNGSPSTSSASVANFALYMLEPKAEVQFTIDQPAS